jgi:hypothetical protein
MLDRPDCWNLALFLDTLPVEPETFITSVSAVWVLQWSMDPAC